MLTCKHKHSKKGICGGQKNSPDQRGVLIREVSCTELF